MNVGDVVVYSNNLRLRKCEDGRKYAITLDVYKIISLEEDNGYIDVIDINTNRTLRARKSCLIKVYGGN
jgi:hypothetical protein